MNVLVVPEDFRNDQYLLKPLIERLFADIGKRGVKVKVCQDPLLGGIAAALNVERIREVVEQYKGMMAIFILCVDRDGDLGRCARLDNIELEFGGERVLLAENAWEEVETWALAGLDLPKEWIWADVRAEVHVKERYFEPLARQRGVFDGPGRGRKALGEEAARNIPAIRQKCREDFDALARRLQEAADGAMRP